jgi:hypothetical protein
MGRGGAIALFLSIPVYSTNTHADLINVSSDLVNVSFDLVTAYADLKSA